jgi:putative membrane protein
MSKGTKTALIIGGTVLAVFIILPIILGIVFRSGYDNWGWGMMGPGLMYGYVGGWLMMIVMVAFWGLIIWGIIVLVRYLSRNGQNYSQDNSSLDILKRRYAQGEINKDEYEEKRKALT